MLRRPAEEELPDLLTFQPTVRQSFDGHDRGAMLGAVQNATRNSPAWGLDLADATVKSGAWDSDLWRPIINAWAEADFDGEGIQRLLAHLSSNELRQRYPREIARVLRDLVLQSHFAN